MIKKTSIILLLLFFILIISPIHAEDANNTTKTFADLNEDISNQEDHVQLNESYRYDSSTDESFSDGVRVSRNMTIIGNGSSIDGNYEARCLIVDSNCNVVMENLTFLNGFSNNDGGGILLRANSSLILKNCIFKNNKVYNSNGGALLSSKGTNTEIYNCQFINNTSIRESNLEWKEFKKGMGSAICTGRGSSLKLYDSTFKSNNAYLTTILIVSFDDVEYNMSSLYVDNCLFENNTSVSSGVIYLDELGNGTIIDSVFRKNRVTDAGATLILDASISAVVKNCLFDQNQGIKGGAIHIKVFDYSYMSNVFISDCNFTRNTASVYGGAISAKYGLTNIFNCRFVENTANDRGGAIYTKLGTLTLSGSFFSKNTSPYGGAICISDGETKVVDSVFRNNVASTKGGAIYSKVLTITSNNCNYISNSAPKGSNVYGAFLAQITQLDSYFSTAEIQVRLTSPWKMPLSQKIKISFTSSKTYKTKWLKTDSRGILKLRIPTNLNAGKYSIAITMVDGVCYCNPAAINVFKAPVKVQVKKLTTSFKSGKPYKAHVVNVKTKKKVSNAQITLKVFTGKKHVNRNLKSDVNGLVSFDTSNLAVGKHAVKMFSKDRNIQLSKKTSSIKIKKAKAKFKYAKNVKRGTKWNVAVKNKETGKSIAKTKLNLRIFTGNKYKTLKVRTDSKGEFKVPTKNLNKGKHKVNVLLKNGNYDIKANIVVRIK